MGIVHCMLMPFSCHLLSTIVDTKAVVSTEAMATPSSHVDGTNFLSPKDRELHPRDTSREVSVESNTSAGSRSNMDDSETRYVKLVGVSRYNGCGIQSLWVL